MVTVSAMVTEKATAMGMGMDLIRKNPSKNKIETKLIKKMANLNMNGPFLLSIDTINKIVEEGHIGNYAYGYLNEEKVFVVLYVGRSDTNLNLRIKHGVFDKLRNPELRYEYFKFSYASTVIEAYEKECKNYHDFGGDSGRLLNDKHPARPENTNLVCPICSQ